MPGILTCVFFTRSNRIIPVLVDGRGWYVQLALIEDIAHDAMREKDGLLFNSESIGVLFIEYRNRYMVHFLGFQSTSSRNSTGTCMAMIGLDAPIFYKHWMHAINWTGNGQIPKQKKLHACPKLEKTHPHRNIDSLLKFCGDDW